jgi:hypothetical protein
MVKKSNKSKPRVIYANRVNLSGLFFSKPIKCVESDDGEWFYSQKYDLVIDEIGLTNTDGCITFSSENKSEVESWTNGARAVMDMLARWSKYA